MTTSAVSILHVLPGTSYGGAESFVWRLVKEERSKGLDSRVLCLKPAGVMAEHFSEAGIPILHLGLQGPGGAVLAIPRLRRVWSRFGFHLAVGWLPMGNAMAGIAARGRAGLLWNLLQADLSPALNGFSTRLLIRTGAWLSSTWPDRVVCNSEAAKAAHVKAGFSANRLVVIPNGVDTRRFTPRPEARLEWRRRLGLGPDAFLVGVLARWDPHKDHRTFIRAAGLASSALPEARYVLAGPGISSENESLSRWIGETPFPERFHLLGPIDDAPSFLGALDIACLSSKAESSPYVLAEAMACGVPCVTTDTGNSAEVLGETGLVVPPGDPGALAQALERMAAEGTESRRERGRAARDRIQRRFDFKDVARRYEEIYRQVVSARSGCQPFP